MHNLSKKSMWMPCPLMALHRNSSSNRNRNSNHSNSNNKAPSMYRQIINLSW